MVSTHRFRSYDGIALEGTYADAGGAKDSVAVLVHGITSSRDEFGLFSIIADHLASTGVPSFRFDYRCHGESDLPMEMMTLSGIVNDIEAAAVVALRLTGASRANVVGMSFGGGLSAFWASTTSLSVSSVAMLAPVLDYEEDILGQYGAIVDQRLADVTASELGRRGFIEMGGIRYGAALLNELRHFSGVEGIRRLKCDSLILHGDADSIVPYASSERWAQVNARCTLVNVPGTDHGFAVGDDEDLSSPETKAKHREVAGRVSEFILRRRAK